MWSWKRNKPDQLTQLFRERYNLHLLRQPRADVSVGDVYPVVNGETGQPGKLSFLVSPSPKLPQIREGEVMADIAGTTSDAVTAETGASFLDSFLAALGAVGIQGKLKTAMEAERATGVKFRFSGATRDYVDPFEFESLLGKRKYKESPPLMKPDYRYYVVLGVVRTNQISFAMDRKDSGKASVDVELFKLADTHAGITTTNAAGEEVTVSGATRLAFGVQLNELSYNKAVQRLEISIPDTGVQARSSRSRKPGYSVIGGPDGDLFL